MGGEAVQLSPIHVLFMSTHLQAERVLSFIPPDGPFKLLSYQIGSQGYVQCTLQWDISNLTLGWSGSLISERPVCASWDNSLVTVREALRRCLYFWRYKWYLHISIGPCVDMCPHS